MKRPAGALKKLVEKKKESVKKDKLKVDKRSLTYKDASLRTMFCY